MSNQLQDEILNTLRSSNLFCDEDGEILKDKVIDYAIKNNQELFNLLFKNKKLKEFFFLQ